MKVISKSELKKQVSYHRNRFRKQMEILERSYRDKSIFYSFSLFFEPGQFKQFDKIVLITSDNNGQNRDIFKWNELDEILNTIHNFVKNKATT